jgi:hypothetical protein
MIEYEVADEEVRDDRVAQVWCVAGAFKRDQPRMWDCVRYGSPARRSDDRILRPLDDQGRTSYLSAELEDIFSVIGPLRVQAAQDGLRIGLQAHPIASSSCLVECGSVNVCAKVPIRPHP